MGLIIIPSSFGLRNTVAGWGAVFGVSIIGIGFLLIGVLGSILNAIENKLRKEKQEKLQSSRSVMRLSDIEIKRMVDEAGIIDLEQFEKERSSEYEFKYVLVADNPKNAICIISKTTISKNKPALQCPSCQNYYLTKYLLSWLDKNSKCLICQFELKVKK